MKTRFHEMTPRFRVAGDFEKSGQFFEASGEIQKLFIAYLRRLHNRIDRKQGLL